MSETLDLSGNFIEGALPTELGALLSSVNLDFGSNFFSGTIPSDIGLLQNLVVLDLQLNAGLTGTVPVEVLNLPNLEVLELTGTQVGIGPTDAPGETPAPSSVPSLSPSGVGKFYPTHSQSHRGALPTHKH